MTLEALIALQHISPSQKILCKCRTARYRAADHPVSFYVFGSIGCVFWHYQVEYSTHQGILRWWIFYEIRGQVGIHVSVKTDQM